MLTNVDVIRVTLVEILSNKTTYTLIGTFSQFSIGKSP